MKTYREKLEEAVERFQPDVEEIFDVSLGKIYFRPILPSEKKRFVISIAGTSPLKYSIPEDPGLRKYFAISYNQNFLFNFKSKNRVNWIAIHEMAHLAHAKCVGAEDYNRTPIFIAEPVADYVAYSILGIEVSKFSLFGDIFLRDIRDVVNACRVNSLRETLLKEEITIKDYVRDFERYKQFMSHQNIGF